VAKAEGVQHWPYELFTYVRWCGHLQEMVLVPCDDGSFGEVPVIGEAT
jgi:hypothetical protein